MPGLHIRTLGEFTVRRGDAVVPADAWPTQKSLALFKLLVTERGRWVAVERLLEALWPSMPAKSAQNNLWVTVGQARRALEPHLPARAPSAYILSDKEGYRFNTDAPYTLDAEAFQRLVDSAFEDGSANKIIDLEAARALYRGDYLPDDRDEPWAAPTRTALLARYLDMLAVLGALYIRQGRQGDAIFAAQEGLRRAPGREDLAQLLMLAGALMGNRELALRAYEELCAALAAQGRTPAAQTEELLQRIRRSPVADAVTLLTPQPDLRPQRSARPSLHRPPLVGRKRELSLIERALSRTEAERDLSAGVLGATVFVEGEPGSGKSRLLEEVAARARDHAWRTLAAACYEVDQATPYRVVATLLGAAHARWPWAGEALPEQTRAELAILCPAMGAAGGAHGEAEHHSVANLGGQGRLPRALAAYLGALAQESGLLLLLDDVHWADPSTLRLLRRLTQANAGLPMLLVCTYGGEYVAQLSPLEEFVQHARRLPQVTHLPLRRLEPQQVNEWVRELAGGRGEPGALAAWLHQASEGNPLHALTLLHNLAEEGVPELKGAAAWQVDPARLPARDPTLALPDALRTALRERVQRLPAASRRLLEQVAVFGRPASAADLQSLLGAEGAAVGVLLDDLVRRSILRPLEDNRYAFSHDKLCEAVYVAMGGARRAALHRATALLLAEAGTDVDPRDNAARIARHFEEGREWARAVAWLERAARRALQLTAGSEALAFCTRSVALGRAHPDETPPARLLELTVLRGRTRIQLGVELDGAVADLEEALAAVGAADPARSFDLHVTLGAAQANGGQLRAARRRLDDALAIAAALDDPVRRVQALYHLGVLAWIQGDNLRAASLYRDALALCDARGLDGRPRALALHGMGETEWAAAAPRAALHCYEESVDLAQRSGERDIEEENQRTVGWTCTGALGLADYARARAATQESLALTDGAEPWHLPLTLGLAGHVLACTGDYAGGLEHLRSASALAERRGQSTFTCVARDLLGDLYADLRLYDAALGEYSAAVAAGEAENAGLWLPRARMNVAATRLRLGALRAREELEFALDRARASGLILHALRAFEGLAAGSVAAHDPYTALHYAGLLLEHAGDAGMVELEAQARRWRGAALALQGRLEAANDELENALALATGSGRLSLQWEVCTALAFLHRGSDIPRARRHASVAHALLTQTLARLDDPALGAGLLALRRDLTAI